MIPLIKTLDKILQQDIILIKKYIHSKKRKEMDGIQCCQTS